jgi:hypothetical protein
LAIIEVKIKPQNDWFCILNFSTSVTIGQWTGGQILEISEVFENLCNWCIVTSLMLVG